MLKSALLWHVTSLRRQPIAGDVLRLHRRSAPARPLASGRAISRGGCTRFRTLAVSAGIVLLLITLGGCEAELRKSDAELGLTPSQAVGRHIYDRQCGGCHQAYSPRPLKGPSLQGLFKRPYMKNGMPANDERVENIVVQGRAKMPAFGRALTPEQVERIMEYLHTL